MRMRRLFEAFVAALVLSVPSCSPDSRVDVRVDDPWARTSTGEGGNSAAYMKVLNSGPTPKVLIGARCDAAAQTQIHRTTIDESGLARMGEVGTVEIPAGDELVLEPGGYHLMLLGAGPLAEGDTLTCTLRFETDSVAVRAPVRPM